VVLMTFFDQTFQNLLRRHTQLLSIKELDLFHRDRLTSAIP
jgi:hypothetical protein